MLKTIKGYAAERLDAQPEFAAAAREEHARYFVQLAMDSAATDAAADGDGDQAADPVAREIDNLRIAWRHSIEQKDLSRLWALREPIWAYYDTRGWYAATIELTDDVLGVVEATPDSPDRWQMEVKLRTGLARAMTLHSGYTDEAEDAYRAAYTIIKEHGAVPQIFPVLRNLASFHGFRGETEKGVYYANEILRLAESEGDASMRVNGYVLLGANTGFGGDLEAGLAHLDEAIRTFEGSGFRSRQLRFGLDPRVSCLTTSGFFLWLLGFPDRAVERADRAIQLATRLDHPYTLAYAFYHAGFLHLWRREAELVRDRAEAALGVAETSDLQVWQALGTCLLGAATSRLGRPDEGLRQMADGVDRYHGLRTPPVFWPMIRFMQAAACVDAGMPDLGFPLIDEALAVGGHETILSPLFHVVRGDLFLLGPAPDPTAATGCYERADAVADSLGARMLGLRAATRLCRTATDADRADRLVSLRAIHATFTEGQSTPDLREAAELLS
jgi:adenylate cyclase